MWSYQQYPTPEDILHFGVLGMKWGVRRERPSTGGSGGSQGSSTSGSSGPKGSSTPVKSGAHNSDSASDKRLMSRIKNEDDVDGWVDLMKEIKSKSGDWYNSNGVSEGFKKALSDQKAKKAAIEQKYGSNPKDRSMQEKKSLELEELDKQYREHLSGVVLKDLGYENTAKGRQFLLDQHIIFTD